MEGRRKKIPWQLCRRLQKFPVCILLAGILMCGLSLPLRVEAADLSMVEEIDFDEIEQSVNEILGGEFQFQNTVLELLNGEQPWTLEGFVSAVAEQVGNNWRTEKHLLLSILLLGIAAALMSNFSNIFQNVTMASGSTTALVFYEFFLGLIYFIQRLIQNGLMTLIQVHVILVFINHLTKEEYLSQMKEMTTKITVWLLKSMLAVVIGFNTIQGILNPAVDSLKTTLFSRAAEMIPGIGNIAGSVTDVVLGSSVLIKNGIGVAALMVIVLICLLPLVKLGVLMMILELAAALLQPVSDKRMTGCVTGVGEGIRLLFRVVFTTAVLFMLTIAVVTVSVRG